jgi:tetratricopeptide repeat protein 21B
MLALANLYLSRAEFDLCQHQCIAMLRADPTNEDASMMLANLMFRKGDYDAAVFHFQQLLQKRPDHYIGLARLIELLRCAGKISDAQRFIALAEAKQSHTNRSGLFYCRGLISRYTGNLREALINFNVSRGDPEWGTQSREHMVRIYLGEDTELFMGDDDDEPPKSKSKGKDKDKDEKKEGTVEETNVTVNVNSAKELLRELTGGKPAEELKHKVWEAYTLIMTKQKQQVEQAITALAQLCAGEDPDPSALLALSVAHMALRQAPKARNQLRRLVKMEWRIDRAPEFERGWLLLSHIYIDGSKYDLAQELLKQCLAKNKSCAKAWELLGYIMEKEQSYRDAADNYENAWKMGGESDPAVGFRLAFNYLKAKRYVEAILVCHKVLAVSPHYPKIKKDILDRARNSLRP